MKISNKILDDSLSGFGRGIYVTGRVLTILVFLPAIGCDFQKVCKEKCGVVRIGLDHLSSFALEGADSPTGLHF